MERRQNVVLGGIVAGRPALDVLVVAEHDVLRLDGPRLLRHDLGQWGGYGLARRAAALRAARARLCLRRCLRLLTDFDFCSRRPDLGCGDGVRLEEVLVVPSEPVLC